MRRSKTKHQAITLEDEAPRSEGAPSATGGKQKKRIDSTLLKQVDDLVLSEDSVANVQSPGSKIRSRKTHVIGTWNVRNMDEKKLEIIKQVMKQINIVVLGVSELNWIGRGHFQLDDYVVFYSGNDGPRRNGVAFIVRQDIAQAIRRYNPKSDRVISVRLQGKPINITIIQVLAPGLSAAAEEMESFYASIQEEVDRTPKKDVLLIIGDWNAIVGNTAEPNVVGEFGLGVRNEAGKRLVEFCGANDLFIANTCFMQPQRRLYTWASPKGQFRHQIDYVIGRRKWRSSILSAKTRPGVDCGSDHKLLIAAIRVKLKKNYETNRVRPYNTYEEFKDNLKKRFALSNSVSHKQEEQTETGDVKDMG